MSSADHHHARRLALIISHLFQLGHELPVECALCKLLLHLLDLHSLRDMTAVSVNPLERASLVQMCMPSSLLGVCDSVVSPPP